jgi:hypothetical protein
VPLLVRLALRLMRVQEFLEMHAAAQNEHPSRRARPRA